jgi:predicted dinucleotide-binding enzyme
VVTWPGAIERIPSSTAWARCVLVSSGALTPRIFAWVRIGIVGAGRIGGNAGRLFAQAGHEVLFSGSRDQAKLEAAAAAAGGTATGSPRGAVEFGEVVMFSVPWRAAEQAIAQLGDLDGKVVIDTTNQYGADGWEELPKPAVQVNAERMPGAQVVKAFNTLTSGFQAEAAGRGVALFLAGEDAAAKQLVAGLIRDIGFEPVDVGGWAQAPIMEAPRRDGSVYGEEYSGEAGQLIAAALRAGDPDEAARLAIELKA